MKTKKRQRRQERQAKQQRRWHFTEPSPGGWDSVAPEIRELDKHRTWQRYA